MKTLVALYENVGTAREVVSDLIDGGFDREDVSLVARNFDANANGNGDVDVDVRTGDETAEGAAVGAVSGGMIGGLTGLFVGLGALAIPGIGPIIAAGPILSALTGAGIGAGVGAATGGVLGALVGLDVPEEHVEYYAEGIRRGGTLVAVQADESWIGTAEEILNRHQPINIERRSGYWRDEGWEGYNPEADVFTKEAYEKDRNRFSAYDQGYYDYVPGFRTHFGANYADSNYKYTDYEPVYHLGYRLATEDNYKNNNNWNNLEVEARQEWNKGDNGLESAWDDVKDTVQDAWQSVKDALDADDNYDDFYDTQYRRHYMSTYRDSGNDYAYYKPGYRYGYELAHDGRYDDIDSWDDLEAEARDGWNDGEDGLDRVWENIKDSVRHGWEAVTEPFDNDDDTQRFGGNGNGYESNADYGRYSSDFRDHYNANYAGRGNFFDYYEPGYQYGYYLATDDRFGKYNSWDTLEADARNEWGDGGNTAEQTWEDIKDAARHAWEAVSEPFDGDDDTNDRTY